MNKQINPEVFQDSKKLKSSMPELDVIGIDIDVIGIDIDVIGIDIETLKNYRSGEGIDFDRLQEICSENRGKHKKVLDLVERLQFKLNTQFDFKIDAIHYLHYLYIRLEYSPTDLFELYGNLGGYQSSDSLYGMIQTYFGWTTRGRGEGTSTKRAKNKIGQQKQNITLKKEKEIRVNNVSAILKDIQNQTDNTGDFNIDHYLSQKNTNQRVAYLLEIKGYSTQSIEGDSSQKLKYTLEHLAKRFSLKSTALGVQQIINNICEEHNIESIPQFRANRIREVLK